jgi:carboxylesterase
MTDFQTLAQPFSFGQPEKGPGVLVLHGFSGTPATVLPLGRRLFEAGFHVEGPLLSGHGTSPWDLGRVRWTDWLDDALRALDRLDRRAAPLFVAGLSMGGALTLHLAARRPDLAGLVLVNHVLFLQPDWLIRQAGWLKHVLPLVPSRGPDVLDPQAPRATYPWLSVAGIHELTKLMDVARAGLASVTPPVLIFRSRQDHVAPEKSATWTFENVGSTIKELVWLDRSYHVATMDFDKDVISEKTIRFFNHLLA